VRFFEVTEPEVKIGRAPDCDLVLADPLASRHHAVLTRNATGYVIQDLNSANGLIINRVRTTSAALAPGDLIEIGKHVLVFEAAVAPLAGAQPTAVPTSSMATLGTHAGPKMATQMLFKPATDIFSSARVDQEGSQTSEMVVSLERELEQHRRRSRILTL